MNNTKLAQIFGGHVAIFIFLNFTLEDAGTIFLILAVIDGFFAYHFYSNSSEKK